MAEPEDYSNLSPEQLAAKLDADLDKFIAGLEKKAYTDGWPEDRWREEMEKHPFFMTKAPEPGEELSPLMQGIQQLKYDENENTPEELANNYKEDGNFNFKCRKYRFAIIAYTEGLKQKCKNDELNAQLYNNRSACNFFLKNYRSCLNDCKAALGIKEEYPKAITRAAQCCLEIQRYDECVSYCDLILKKTPNDPTATELRSKAINRKKVADRDARRQAAAERKDVEQQKLLLDAVCERKIQVKGKDAFSLDLKDLEPQFPDALRMRVHFAEDGRLAWPVVFMYPEYKLTDFVQEFHEDTTFADILEEVFSERPEWDVEGKYIVQNLKVYFGDDDTKLHNVPIDSTLGKALSHKKFKLQGGTPGFMVFVANSAAEKKYTSGS